MYTCQKCDYETDCRSNYTRHLKSKKHQIVIIGGGTAGITVAAQMMRKNKKLDVAIIDPSDKHFYQPAFTLVGAGTFNYDNTIRPMKKIIPNSCLEISTWWPPDSPPFEWG